MCHLTKGPFSLAFAGGVAGCCLWTSIFPADVVKSRVQVSTFTSGGTPGEHATGYSCLDKLVFFSFSVCAIVSTVVQETFFSCLIVTARNTYRLGLENIFPKVFK